jgi:hypothetical protein
MAMGYRFSKLKVKITKKKKRSESRMREEDEEDEDWYRGISRRKAATAAVFSWGEREKHKRF